MATNEIGYHREGYHTIAGTDWPVDNVVYREGSRRYVVAVGLCNGIPAFARTFRTKREAFEYAGITDETDA